MMENMKCEICYQEATGIHYGAKTCDKCKVSSLSGKFSRILKFKKARQVTIKIMISFCSKIRDSMTAKKFK